MKSGGPKIFILTVLLIGAAAGLGWVIFGQFQDQAGSSIVKTPQTIAEFIHVIPPLLQ
jgi:hypothetical protein